MSAEIQLSYQADKTTYALIRNRTGAIWNGSSFETYVTANYSTYSISLTEQGTVSAFYTGTFPAAIPAGVYSLVAKEQVGGSVAETDPTVGTETYQWNGSATYPLADLATSGQLGVLAPLRIAKGTMVQNFPIYLKSATDHVTPITSGVVSGQVARDGGSFGVLQSGTVTERGLGFYDVTLTSGDLNATYAAKLLFTATGADPVPYGLVMQRSSGI